MRNGVIWRLVPSLDSYLASSEGLLMRLPRLLPMPHGGLRAYGGEPTTGQWDGNRYIITVEGKTYKVHRLVCEAFHGSPPFDGAVCMHLDENAANIAPTNLSWGTQKENLNAPGFIAYCRSRTGDNSPTTKARRRAASGG